MSDNEEENYVSKKAEQNVVLPTCHIKVARTAGEMMLCQIEVSASDYTGSGAFELAHALVNMAVQVQQRKFDLGNEEDPSPNAAKNPVTD